MDTVAYPKVQSGFVVTLKAELPKPSGYPKELVTLGDQLKAKRLDLGLLQREVAELVGVTEFTIHNWERGKTRVSKLYLCSVVKFLASNI